MRLVVGYVSNQRGVDAVRLASTLAGSRRAALDIVVVLPLDTPTFDMYSPDRAYQSAMDKQGQEWIDEALALVPEGVHAQGHVVRAESIAEGLVEAATDPAYGIEAHFIVIGAAHRGLIGRFSIGSSAGSLLHSSPVPVALAPVDYEPHPAITRLTCATGLLPGAEVLVELAIGLADDWHVPLRLISLLAMGKERSEDARHEIHAIAERHVDDLVAQANDVLPDDFPVTGVLGTGRSLEDCVHALEFESSEIVMVGSSRLGGPKRLFLGASANTILHALPVPMIVVPRDYVIPELVHGD
ncbi:MAG: universal stress protein [Dermatophilaceae bacterium]